jgi:hypothetical protein
MAQSLYIYNQFLNTIANQEINLDGDDLRVMLVSSSYSPSREAHKYKDNVDGEITGAGYTTGGETLTNVTYVLNDKIATLKADNPKWTALNISNIRYAVIYDNTPSTNKPLIAYVDFGETLSLINAELEIVWNSDGIIRFTIN